MGSKGAFAAAIVCTTFGCIFLITSIASTGWIKGCLDPLALAKQVASSLGGGDTGGRHARDLSDMWDSKPGENPLSDTDWSHLGDTIKNAFESAGQSNPLGDVDLSHIGDSVQDALDSVGQSNPLSNVDLSHIGDSVQDALDSVGQSNPLGNVDLSDVGDSVKDALDGAEDPVHEEVGQSNPMPNIDLSNLNIPAVCMEKGIYRISFSQMGMHSSVPIPGSSIPIGMIIGFAGILIAVICSIAAIIVLITVVSSNAESYEDKGRVVRRARIGMILLMVGGVFGLSGMIACTVEGAHDLNNPMRIASALEDVFTNMLNSLGPGNRRRRDLSDPAGMMSMAFSALKLHFDYAFYFGWAGVILLVIGVIVSTVAKQRLISQPYSGHDSAVKL